MLHFFQQVTTISITWLFIRPELPGYIKKTSARFSSAFGSLCTRLPEASVVWAGACAADAHIQAELEVGPGVSSWTDYWPQDLLLHSATQNAEKSWAPWRTIPSVVQTAAAILLHRPTSFSHGVGSEQGSELFNYLQQKGLTKYSQLKWFFLRFLLE